MAKACVYVFLCCCGMTTVYCGLGYVLHQMNGDTVIGMGMGLLLALGIMRLNEFLEERGAGFSAQGDKAPAKRW